MVRLALIVIILGILGGCSDGETEVIRKADTVARVNGKEISQSRLEYQFKKSTPERSEKERMEALERLTQRIALADKARDLGLAKDPMVQETVEGILISRLRERILFPRIEGIRIDEVMVAEYYGEHLDQYTDREQIKVAVLWFDSRGKRPLEMRYENRLNKVREQIMDGVIPIKEGFGNLAIQNSEHSGSRYKGGVIGWLEAGSYPDDFRQNVLRIARDLKEAGDLSELVVSDAGSFLVRLLEKRPERIVPLPEVADTIERKLKREAREELEKQFVEEMLAGSQVEIY